MAVIDNRPPFRGLEGRDPGVLFASVPTPSYILYEKQLKRKGKILASVAENTGAKI